VNYRPNSNRTSNLIFENGAAELLSQFVGLRSLGVWDGAREDRPGQFVWNTMYFCIIHHTEYKGIIITSTSKGRCLGDLCFSVFQAAVEPNSVDGLLCE
jgi:hypothetical protein